LGDSQITINTVHDSLKTTPISGVTVIVSGGSSSENSGGSSSQTATTESSDSGAGGSESDSGSSLEFSDSLLLTYKTISERDSLLQRILSVYRTTLSSLNLVVSGLRIKFVREVAGSDGSRTVFFLITGQSSQPVSDTQATIEAVHSTLTTTPIDGVSLVVSGSSDVDITDSLVLTYSSTSERDSLLQQILTVWQSISSLSIININIQFVSEASAHTAGAHTVTYRITGSSRVHLSVEQSIQLFYQALQTTPITGVILVSVDQAESGNAGNSDNSLAVDTSGDIASSDGGSFAYTKSIFLPYNTPAERDTFLDRLTVIWRNSLNDYVPTDVKVTLVSDKKNVGKMPADKGGWTLNEVTYRLTGSSRTAFDIEAVTKVFEQTVVDAHLGSSIVFNIPGFSNGL
jgi:hypothetical protein